MLLKKIFLFALLLQLIQVKAADFTFSANCLAAQEHILALRFAEAQTLLDAEKKASPANHVPLLLENYIDFLKNIINEEETLYKQTKGNEARRLKALRNKPVASPWYRYTQAEIMLQWAFVKLKTGDNLSAGSNIRDAYRLLKQNAADYPSFALNGKSLGLIEALIGTVPEQYSWVVKLVGLQGNIESGAARIKTCLDAVTYKKEEQNFKIEAAFVYAMVQHHLQKKSELAWGTIEPYTRDYRQNMLQNYMRALLAGYSGRNDEAVAVLSSKPSYFSAYPFYFMDYMLGVAKLRKLDKGADIHFKIYTVKHPGGNYIKSAYRYLAWSSLIQGNMADYKTYCSLCSKKGSLGTEEDKQSLKEAVAAEPPDLNLLRGRLLFDGRYYERALAYLYMVSENGLKSEKEKLEYYYRYGRVYHEQKNYEKARIYYQKTIDKGRNMPCYFAAYSALQLGFICEAEKQNEKAISYFKMAMDEFPKNKEYKGSIEQKAKAGLKRLGR